MKPRHHPTQKEPIWNIVIIQLKRNIKYQFPNLCFQKPRTW